MTKLLVCGFENTGKTTLISQLKDALVVSTDNKVFRGKVPHFRYSTYNGIHDFIDTLNSKIEAYNAKYGEFPKTVVIDSITHLNNAMEEWASEKFTGFKIYENLGKEILAINRYFEDVLIANNVNVVITAHTQYDPDTGKYKIHSSGSFGKQGSWLSVVDNAIFIEAKSGKRIIHHSTMKFPCRTLLPDMPEHQPIEEYDINAHLDALAHLSAESKDFEI